MYQFTPITQDDWALINGDTRMLGMDRPARLALAVELGVSERTVARWVTQAGQRRNIIPRTWIGKSSDAFTPDQLRRIHFGRLLIGDVKQPGVGTGKAASYESCYGDPGTALAYSIELAGGGIDPYLARAWTKHSLHRDGEGRWCITVDYTRLLRGES